MSEDIDVKNFTGDTDFAAESQTNATNTFAQTEDFPVHEELLDKPLAQEAQASPEESTSIGREHFKALASEVERIKAEKERDRAEYQQQIDLLKANISQRSSQDLQPQREQPQRIFDGFEDDYIPSVKEIRSAWDQREQEYGARIEELQVAQQHPDYAEVLDKYLTPLVRQKPHLIDGINGAKNKALFAYELGVMARQAQLQSQPQQAPPQEISPKAERIVQNSQRPGSLSNVGGGGTLSKADYYANMSDQEFMQLAQRNLDQI